MLIQNSSHCENCNELKERISVLEGRISVLHSIKEDELFLESLLESRGADAASLLCPKAELPVSGVVSEEWPRMGARPKICSTPATTDSWTNVPLGRRRGRRTSLPLVPKELRLTNAFQALDGLSQPLGELQDLSTLRDPAAAGGPCAPPGAAAPPPVASVHRGSLPLFHEEALGCCGRPSAVTPEGPSWAESRCQSAQSDQADHQQTAAGVQTPASSVTRHNQPAPPSTLIIDVTGKREEEG
ncbi:hypothetical protein SKAU_G00410920 [Synaphobranchus kaupii]|uniref:Uncharacterized protein n=1 Tax=Synaphobranchus kaupii TaxID=118154 RepID=A0A9Q1E7R0_SYNKA|nr:hypothetical protein SKAU_G00410920 [Synaphobranchus kaupii]